MRKKKRELKNREKILISISVAFIITVLFIFMFSVISTFIDLPIQYGKAIGIVISAVFGYTASYILGLLSKNDGIKCGLIIGTVLGIIFLLSGIITHSLRLSKIFITYIFSITGGIIGINSKFRKF